MVLQRSLHAELAPSRKLEAVLAVVTLLDLAAAIVATHIVGTPVEEFRSLHQQMAQMLAGQGAPPGGRWSDLRFLEPVRDYRARHASTLLVFEAVEAALRQAEGNFA